MNWLGYNEGEAVEVYKTSGEANLALARREVQSISPCDTHGKLRVANKVIAKKEGVSGLAMYAKANAR